MSFFQAMFGDDFPDAFANGDGRSCKSRKTFLDLPAEVLDIVCQTLSNTDIKRLRLTSRELSRTVQLRIDRVYVSPNRANLDCLNSILNHPQYRLRVNEIVWDDAQLDEYPTLQHFCQALDYDSETARVDLEDHLQLLIRSGCSDNTDCETINIEDCVQEDGKLTDIGKVVLLRANDRKSRNIIASNAAKMSVEESYVLYQKLYQDEKEIIKRGWDTNGLHRALMELPNLKRVTVTSEVWRPWNLIPAYDTPFFRALPASFQKPSLWPWIDRPEYPQPLPHLRERDQSIGQRLPTEWRGYSIVVSSLITYHVPHLQEFIVDTGSEVIGLPPQFSTLPYVDYTDTIRMLSTTGIKRLQLSLLDHPGTKYGNTNYADMDPLEHILSAVPHLEHLDLKWSLPPRQVRLLFSFNEDFFERKCINLKYIALHHAWVTRRWLFNLITTTRKLETVVLDKIWLYNGARENPFQCRDNLFERIRNHFAAECLRGPKFTWIEQIWCLWFDYSPGEPKHWQVLDDELNAYLYDGAEKPWEKPWATRDRTPEQRDVLKPGFGWIMYGRDSTFRKDRREMISGGFLPRNPWPLAGRRLEGYQMPSPP